MASIDFYTNGIPIQSSGLGMYSSAGFGYSIAVSSFNERCYITDSTGTVQGAEGNNCKYLNSSGVVLGQTGSGVHVLALPNYLATLNIRFTNATVCRTQNSTLTVYDRVSTNNNPSGVNCYALNVVHPSNIATISGSGTSAWQLLGGSGSILSLANSPGTSGFSPNGTSTSDTRHDIFVALSCSPTSVSSKLFSAFVSLEYL